MSAAASRTQHARKRRSSSRPRCEQQGGHEAAVPSFCGRPGAVTAAPQPTEALDANASNPAAALQLAAATIPDKFVPQVVLLTDGNETARRSGPRRTRRATFPSPSSHCQRLPVRKSALRSCSRRPGRAGRRGAAGSGDLGEPGNDRPRGPAPGRGTRRPQGRGAAARREPSPPANAAGRRAGRYLHGATRRETRHSRREQPASSTRCRRPAAASPVGRHGTASSIRSVSYWLRRGSTSRSNRPRNWRRTRPHWTPLTCWSSPTYRPKDSHRPNCRPSTATSTNWAAG